MSEGMRSGPLTIRGIRLAAALWLALTAPARVFADPVAYLTDVEGKMEKFESFLKDNPHVYRDASGRVQVRPGSIFVFGGDAVDHGSGNLEVVETLVDLKRRFPKQVILIAGNRDINKIQIPEWLSPESMKELPEAMVPWLRDRIALKLGLSSPDQLPDEALESHLARENTRENRLRWTLEHRMNARSSFENHRAEIAGRRGVPSSSVSDTEVVEAFEDMLKSDGRFREFLSKSQLAFVHENTLYIHGALTEENIGAIPGKGSGARLRAREWAERLNTWYRAQLRPWERGSTGKVKPHPSESLLAYQRWRPGTRSNQDSVIYARYSDESGNPVLPGKKVADWLRRSDLHRVVSGHTPNGDTPTVLRGNGVEFLVGDNTYADHASHIFVDGDSVRIRSQASLKDGSPRVLDHAWKVTDDTPLGQRLPGTDYLVKGRLEDGRWLLFRTLPDFTVEQAFVGDSELLRSFGTARPAVIHPACAGLFSGIAVQ